MIINSKGSMAVESFLLVPVIMIIVFIFTTILIISFEKTIDIISVHRIVLNKNDNILDTDDINENLFEYSIENEYEVNGEHFKTEYIYSKKYISARDVQEILEVILYLLDEYDEFLKGIKSNVKK